MNDIEKMRARAKPLNICAAIKGIESANEHRVNAAADFDFYPPPA